MGTLVSAMMTAAVALAQRIQVKSFLASSITFLRHHNTARSTWLEIETNVGLNLG